MNNCDVTVFLYDGYDWARTRRIIEEKAKEMRRRLARIRQLVANGQTPDPSVEETNTLLFNSVYIGIEHNIDEVEPAALMAEIDEELNEGSETASQSSWQSFKPQHFSPGSPRSTDQEARKARRKLTRSRGPCIEFRLQGLSAEVDNYRSHPSTASRTLATIVDLEILDHIKTSTWSKFLTSLRTDSRGNIRETDSNMVRVELRQVYPVAGNPAEESRLRVSVLSSANELVAYPFTGEDSSTAAARRPGRAGLLEEILQFQGSRSCTLRRHGVHGQHVLPYVSVGSHIHYTHSGCCRTCGSLPS